jgi:hypothetical protein
MAEALAVGALQRHGQVAVEPQSDDHPIAGKPLQDALRKRDESRGADFRARCAGKLVLDGIREPVSLPAGKHPRPLAIVGHHFGDERDIGRERLRDALHEPLEKALAHRAGRALGDEPQQILAAGPADGPGVRIPRFQHEGDATPAAQDHASEPKVRFSHRRGAVGHPGGEVVAASPVRRAGGSLASCPPPPVSRRSPPRPSSGSAPRAAH